LVVWRAAHKDELTAYRRVYCESHKSEMRTYDAARYEARKEQNIERRRKWRNDHKEHCAAYNMTSKHLRRARELGAPVNDLTAAQWRKIKLDANGRCHYCGETVALLTRDHAIPLVRGGSNTASNIVASCLTCNKRKGTRTADEFTEYLNRIGIK
jgi:5-methylcytosine-specific restriction endonuclease McrA